jgi:hypothetical protein
MKRVFREQIVGRALAFASVLFPDRPVSDLVRRRDRSELFILETRAAVEEAIENMKGAKGVRLRLALSMVERLRPTFIDDNVERLLPDVALRLDRMLASRPEGDGVAETLTLRAPDVAEELLTLVDESAVLTQREATLRAYRWCRPFAAEHLIDLIPVIALVLEEHLNAT